MFLFPGLLGFDLLLSFAWVWRVVWLGGFGFGLRGPDFLFVIGAYRGHCCWISCVSVCSGIWFGALTFNLRFLVVV